MISGLLPVVYSLTGAASATDRWTEVRPGIDQLHRTTSDPQDIYAVRIDLTVENLGVHASLDARGTERAVPTDTFAENADVLVAINGDWSNGTTPVGIAIGDGDLWHGHIGDDTLGGYWGYFGCTAWKACSMGYAYPLDTSDLMAAPHLSSHRYFQGLGTNGIQLLIDGAPRSGCYDSARNPRSAICLDEDATTLWFVVVDGRRSDAAGMTCTEMRELMTDLGCHDAAMLDGGGSSLLWVEGEILNQPSDGSPRTVAGSIGIVWSDEIDARCESANGLWCDGDLRKGCIGGRVLDALDCADDGGTCQADGLHAMCVDPACPDGLASGATCISETVLAACDDGQYSEADCGAYGLVCADLGEGPACMPGACLEDPRSCECVGEPPETCDEDGDGWPEGAGDCDDADRTVHPEAPELCNDRDDDCDGEADEGLDEDGDGWERCGGDCADDDPLRHPGALEVADGIDQDCDWRVDEGTEAGDDDFDGWTEEAGDCDDAVATIFPGAPEVADGRDQDCDGSIDEGTAAVDDDGDGFSEWQGDCDDGDPGRHPGAVEVADSLDDDCDGRVDEGSAWADDDHDGWTEAEGDCDDASRLSWPGAPEVVDGRDNDCDGRVDNGTAAWDDDGDGWSESEGDCDDDDPDTWPGAPEQPDRGDDDCDGVVDEGTVASDDDGDAWSELEGDCDDTRASAWPGATEVVNGRDDDCDGAVDEDTVASDDDGDGWAEVEGDCDDDDPGRYPGAPEAMDQVDQDCDGLTDEDTPAWDDDGDGWTELDGDCDDGNPGVYPGAHERPDGVDADCDGRAEAARGWFAGGCRTVPATSFGLVWVAFLALTRRLRTAS